MNTFDPITDVALSAMSDQELLERFRFLMGVGVQAIEEAARIVVELETRGRDLEAEGVPFLPYFRRIDEGSLSAAAFDRFRHRPRVMSGVAALPMEDQVQLAAGRCVEMLVIENGETTSRMVDPMNMEPPQVNQVFCREGIRTLAQQRSYIDEKVTRAMIRQKANHPEDGDHVKVDRKRKHVIYHGHTISRAMMHQWLARLDD